MLLLQGSIYSLCFSIEGRFLSSAGADCRILLWDLAHGHLLAELSGHSGAIHSLAFSRDGHILTSGNFYSSNLHLFFSNKIFVLLQNLIEVFCFFPRIN